MRLQPNGSGVDEVGRKLVEVDPESRAREARTQLVHAARRGGHIVRESSSGRH